MVWNVNGQPETARDEIHKTLEWVGLKTLALGPGSQKNILVQGSSVSCVWLGINVHQCSTPMTFAYDIPVSVQNSCEKDVTWTFNFTDGIRHAFASSFLGGCLWSLDPCLRQ